MNLGELLNKLQKAKRLGDGSYIALCPAHADRNPSLHISVADDKILLSCQAGCQTEDVVKAIGIKLSDLFLTRKETPPEKAKIVATYDYQDEHGKLLFQVCRLEPKSFRQRHKNGQGNWSWNVEGVRRVLYHLTDILHADHVYLVEGEKDCDNLWAWGQVATTSPGGASNWKPEYSQYLQGKRVTIIPDNDNAGLEYARDAARSLIGKAATACIMLPKPAKDISEWLDNGGDIEQLPAMEQDISVLLDADKPTYQMEGEAIVWHKEIASRHITFRAESLRMERTGVHGRLTIQCDYSQLGWSLFNVERSEERTRLSNSAYKQLKGDIKEAYNEADMRRDFDIFCAGLWDFNLSSYEAELLHGDDTPSPIKFLLKPYIIEGGGTIIFAAPGRGKSFTALLWAVSTNNGISKFWTVDKATVLFINLERSRESVQRRLSAVNKLLGLPATKPLLILNARGKSLSEVAAPIKKMVDKFGVKLVILDSVSRAGYGDLTENRPVNAIMDSLSSLCPSWVALAHTPRADESHVFGGIMFEAAADIVVKLSSEVSTDGTLGVGYEITKSNDVPHKGQELWAMEFNEESLSGFRTAKPYEFPEIEGKSKKSMIETIEEFILNADDAVATATQIAEGTGFSRKNISLALSNPAKFTKLHRDKSGQYYGLRDNSQPLF